MCKGRVKDCVLAPVLCGFFLVAGCFQYDPSQLRGYGVSQRDGEEGFEVDVTMKDDGQPVEGEEVEVELREGDEADFEAEADIDTEEGWEVPSSCGNGLLEDPEECDGDPDGTCSIPDCDFEGIRRCEDCKWVCLPAPDENCNGIDEDCDGEPDDDYVSTHTCGSGVCERGSYCLEGREGCNEGTPTGDDTDCDGQDNDCDGVVDDGYVPHTCGEGVCVRESTCIGGVQNCVEGPAHAATDSICDGIDEDCDGESDEDYVTTQTCGYGPCERFYRCINGEETCTPGIPLAAVDTSCNNVDEDCDGRIDDDYVPYTCGRGICRRNSTCSGGAESCIPGEPEATDDDCDGQDDNCNGFCDEEYVASRTCGRGVCVRSYHCDCGNESCTPGVPTGTDANCNGIDENCNGVNDDNYVPYTCGVGKCLRNSTCVDGRDSCTPGAPDPRETCGNGIDDDCDGQTDGADPDCTTGACTPLTVITSPGGRYTAALQPHSLQGTCGGAGAEAYFTFTLSGDASDVFLATHQTAGINTVMYVRYGTCAGAQVACNADADGLQTSRIQLTSLAAGTYYVIVDTVSGVSSGDVTLDAYISPTGSASDRCSSPAFIPSGTTVLSGTVVGYTNDYSNVLVVECPWLAAREDRVYYFYLPTSRSVTFNGCAGHPYSWLQIIYVRSICSDGSMESQVVCNDDASCDGDPQYCNDGAYNSAFTATLGPGLYYLFIDGYRIGGDNPCNNLGGFRFTITNL